MTEFARYLGIPTTTRMPQTQITDAVCHTYTAADVQLVLIDEIHRLNPRTITGAQTADRHCHVWLTGWDDLLVDHGGGGCPWVARRRRRSDGGAARRPRPTREEHRRRPILSPAARDLSTHPLPCSSCCGAWSGGVELHHRDPDSPKTAAGTANPPTGRQPRSLRRTHRIPAAQGHGGGDATRTAGRSVQVGGAGGRGTGCVPST
ncbi:hypothetical protein ABZW44_35960 [Streptomyces mirabilis]